MKLIMRFILFNFWILSFIGSSEASSFKTYSHYQGRMFLALSSNEVKNFIGVYKSDDDINNIGRLALNRAHHVCDFFNGQLVDFTVSGQDIERSVNFANNKRVHVIRQDDSLDFLSIGVDTGLFALTGGISALARIGSRGTYQALGVEGSALGAMAGIQELIEGADLTDIWSYNYLVFDKITCLDNHSPTRDRDLFVYTCTKGDFHPAYCNHFNSVYQAMCFERLLKKNYFDTAAIQICQNIQNEGQFVFLSSAVERDPNLALLAINASRGLTSAQAIALEVLAMRNYNLNYAVNLVRQVQNMEQAIVIRELVNRGWHPNYVVPEALKIKNEKQAQAAFTNMQAYAPHIAIEFAVKNN